MIADGSIPFNRPSIQGDEMAYMQGAIEGGHSSAAGPYSELASAILRDELGAVDVLLTTSCTDALEMAAMLLDIRPGDTVVVPSFGFVTTALAFRPAGASCHVLRHRAGATRDRPAHLADPRRRHGPRSCARSTTAGWAATSTGFSSVMACWPRVALIEDNAHGLFGPPAAAARKSAGRFSTLSFHETKNFICGEGGALVLNAPDDIERAHVVYDKGTNRPRSVMLGEVDKYTWVDTGSSFGLSDVLAAFLYGQLLQRDEIVRKRRAASQRYHSLLAPRCADLGLELIDVPEDCVRADHLFAVLAPDRKVRDRILRRMQTQGVHATFHYVPLHESPGGRGAAARPTHCPVSTEIAGRLLRLPFYTDLTDDEAVRVVETLITAIEAG